MTLICDYLCHYYLQESLTTFFWKGSRKFEKATLLPIPTGGKKKATYDCFTFSSVQVTQHLRFFSSMIESTYNCTLCNFLATGEALSPLNNC